jgi:hypothetical protein
MNQKVKTVLDTISRLTKKPLIHSNLNNPHTSFYKNFFWVHSTTVNKAIQILKDKKMKSASLVALDHPENLGGRNLKNIQSILSKYDNQVMQNEIDNFLSGSLGNFLKKYSNKSIKDQLAILVPFGSIINADNIKINTSFGGNNLKEIGIEELICLITQSIFLPSSLNATEYETCQEINLITNSGLINLGDLPVIVLSTRSRRYFSRLADQVPNLHFIKVSKKFAELNHSLAFLDSRGFLTRFLKNDHLFKKFGGNRIQNYYKGLNILKKTVKGLRRDLHLMISSPDRKYFINHLVSIKIHLRTLKYFYFLRIKEYQDWQIIN